ncbi:hypothetical protein L6452_07097 [Arctium lappa]|uniref:Uncharacterized protein n=1 Tax=Arctium lappa TaxID=4217 RepID=A0ACB9EKI9_ARCLA|nr:hypothetical protein L6452_07097 [Arctium lappa]
MFYLTPDLQYLNRETVTFMVFKRTLLSKKATISPSLSRLCSIFSFRFLPTNPIFQILHLHLLHFIIDIVFWICKKSLRL